MYDESAIMQSVGLIEGGERPTTVTQSLERERDKLTRRLEELNSVIEQLKAQPEIQKLLDALSQLGHGIY